MQGGNGFSTSLHANAKNVSLRRMRYAHLRPTMELVTANRSAAVEAERHFIGIPYTRLRKERRYKI